MEKVIEKLKEEKIKLNKEIDEYGLLKLKKEILSEIIISLKSNKTYYEINEDLTFLETRLSLIYTKEETDKYNEIIKMLLLGLAKCEKDSNLYPNHYQDFRNKLLQVIKLLENDLNNTNDELKNINITKKRNLLATIKRTLRWLKDNKFTEEMLKDVKRVLKQLNYSDDEILLFLEKCDEVNVLGSDDIEYNDMVKLLNYQFIYFDDINLSYDERSLVNKVYYDIISVIDDDVTLTDLNVLILELEKYSSNIKKGILEKLLKYFKSKYLENKVLLYDEDFYFSKEFKHEIFNECEKSIDFYEFLFGVYQKIDNDIKVENIPHNSFNLERKFLFAKNNEMSYFERDLRNLGEEVLNSAYGLLNDTLGQSPFVIWKKMVGFENLYEFKYNNLNNQLRIMCRNLGNNNYVIIGLMQKKCMSSVVLYSRYDERVLQEDRINEYKKSFESDYERIKDYILSNQRKSARK